MVYVVVVPHREIVLTRSKVLDGHGDCAGCVAQDIIRNQRRRI
jgi:hypothetical protein